MIVIFCFLSAGYAFAVGPTDNTGQKSKEKEQKPALPDTVSLPNIEYKSEGLRDPFEGVFKTEPIPSRESIGQLPEAPPEVSPPPLTVQGIIWGGNIPQAIINDKVVKVGDSISEAKVTYIGRDGIAIIFKDYTFKLTSPAAAQLQSLKASSKGGRDEK